jgi:putative FmdB family regulatory protein
MPIYIYECLTCKKEFETVSSVADRNKTKCECGGETKILIKNTNLYDPLTPYWSENIDKNPVYIESRSHRQKLMKEKHLDIMPYKKFEVATAYDRNGHKMTQHEIEKSRTRGMFDKNHKTPEWNKRFAR